MLNSLVVSLCYSHSHDYVSINEKMTLNSLFSSFKVPMISVSCKESHIQYFSHIKNIVALFAGNNISESSNGTM